MKKISYLLLLIIMFIPCIVNAETCDNDKIIVSSITIDNKSDNVNETDAATIDDKTINLNLNMSNVGDNIRYKINVKNDSNDDYLLDKNSVNVSSDYVDYIIESEDNSNIVKAKTSKNIYLRVNYSKQVPTDAFENGVFNDKVYMKVNLSTSELENPSTGIKYISFMLFVVLLLGVMLMIFRKKQLLKIISLLIVLSIIIPISVNALCKCDISINSTIQIEKSINGIVYRYNDRVLNIGDSIYEQDVQRWCLMLSIDGGNPNKFFSCETDKSQNTYTTEEDCLNMALEYNNSPSWDHSKNNFSCEMFTISKGIGDYYEDASQINKTVYLKHLLENNIVKESYVCFVTNNNEYCMQGGISGENILCNDWNNCAPNYMKNYNLILNLNAWYRNNGGMCYDYDNSSSVLCERFPPHLYADVYGVVYASDTAVYTNRFGREGIPYCIVNEKGSSVCI